MIHSKEINAVAAKKQIERHTQIEKDYILSWVLYGLAHNEQLSKQLIFKGGTVLKKTYFPEYRFSEDLDFTLLDEKITNEELLQEFEKIYASIREEANIILQFGKANTHISGSLSFYINYVGLLQGNMNSRNIKIDITRGEILEYPVEKRSTYWHGIMSFRSRIFRILTN